MHQIATLALKPIQVAKLQRSCLKLVKLQLQATSFPQAWQEEQLLQFRLWPNDLAELTTGLSPEV